MPPKASGASAQAATKKAVASTSKSAGGPKSEAAAAKKRARNVSESNPSNHIFLCGFTVAEMEKYDGMMDDDWAIDKTLSDSVTHVVIKSMMALKHSQQLLPIYYAVLKGLWVLKPSFLPTAGNRRKSLGGPALENEKAHVYDGKELDANATANANFPSILDIVRLRSHVEELKEEEKSPILGSAPFQKVAILAGRMKDSKQRKEELKLVMEAGGATVVDDAVFKTWKAKRKKGGDIETPSIVVIVNGESNPSAIGLDDEVIRDVLKARAPLFYEEFITNYLTYMMNLSLDELLLQSFVFIHDQMKNIDPDNKLQALVLNEDEDEEMPSLGGGKTPAGRRPNSRVSSSTRESSSTEQIVKEKKKGRREKEEEVEKEKEMKEEEEEEEEKKELPPSRAKEQKKEEEEATFEVKKGRGRAKKNEKKEEEDEKEEVKMEDETTKGPKKEVSKGRARKESVKKEIKGKKEETKEIKKEEEEEMEEEDVDPALADGNLDLLDEFEKEIEEGKDGGGRRKKRTDKEMKELEEMREDRGDNGEDEEEQPVTPEPILFSQLATQPAIEITEEPSRAVQGGRKEMKKEEDREIKMEEEDEDGAVRQKTILKNTGRLIDENASDDGSDTIVGEERDDDIDDMERLREEMNNERGAVKKEEEEERSDTPMGDQPASEFGMRSTATIAIEDAKECETCNHLGTQHLYINQQMVADIEDHFLSPRLDWFDHIIEVKEKMPWIKDGRVLRPACGLDSRPMLRNTIDLFFSFYHELDDESKESVLLDEINSSDAMEMYEADWEEPMWRRPPLDLMIKMLHEFSVKRHSEDLLVPDRACSALKNALPVILPSSTYGRHFWLTVLAGGSHGIKGRASQVMEEMAKRCKTFFTKALLNGFYPTCVVDFVVYFSEVDLLCAQTPVIGYEDNEEDTMETQKANKGKKIRKKKNPLDTFPLILLMVMELDEDPRRGLSESAMLVLQKLLELAVGMRRHNEWSLASTLERALLCLLEAARWHCAKAVSSALTGAERRRVKAAESASQAIKADGTKTTMELQQNVQKVVKWALNRGVLMSEIRDTLTLCWLEDIVNEM